MANAVYRHDAGADDQIFAHAEQRLIAAIDTLGFFQPLLPIVSQIQTLLLDLADQTGFFSIPDTGGGSFVALQCGTVLFQLFAGFAHQRGAFRLDQCPDDADDGQEQQNGGGNP